VVFVENFNSLNYSFSSTLPSTKTSSTLSSFNFSSNTGHGGVFYFAAPLSLGTSPSCQRLFLRGFYSLVSFDSGFFNFGGFLFRVTD
jgi:hypothetical protein